MEPALAPEVSSTSQAKMPRQIPFIIANEGCERFSFYGMRNILVPFLSATLMLHLPEAQRGLAAKDVFHTFVMGVYFFPLLGGWLADRFFGKYNTILWFSLIYSVGQACLAAFSDDRTGFYVGLGLIAFGSGGIKPLVSSFMGDQFDSRTKHLAKLVFDAFYWIINLGSFFASLTMPFFLRELGPRIAFGIPGTLMLISTLVLYLGRHRYVMVPPTPPNPDSLLRVIRTALVTRVPGRGRPGLVLAVLGTVLAAVCFVQGSASLIDADARVLPFLPVLEPVPWLCLALVLLLVASCAGGAMQLDRARASHPEEAVEGVRAVLRVLVLFALITPFWSLFDQKASTWVLQAGQMSKPTWFEPAMMQALNPLLVMGLIPLNNLVLFPWLRKRGWQPTALRRMTLGIALTGLSFVIVGVMQLAIDAGTTFPIQWQVLPYVFLTLGEVLVSATGLEFAYSQAPHSMKGALMSFFLLSNTIGGLWVLLANASIKRPEITAWIEGTGLSTTAFYMFFFAAFAFAASLVFGLYARRYREVDHYRV